MAVFYKFKSAKDYCSIPIESPFISVADLKERIFESKNLWSGTDYDLIIFNAHTNEEYLDEAMLIPRSSSVLVCRIPGLRPMPIITEQQEKKLIDDKEEDTEESEGYDFGDGFYAIPEELEVQSSDSTVKDASTFINSKDDEDSRIKALVDTSALDWPSQTQRGMGFGRSMDGGMMRARGSGRSLFQRKTPPANYLCHRCKIRGHFIQHCPTNGDPNYDVKKVRPPTGIPKSMLIETSDGSYALPSGAMAVFKPNEAAFEMEIEGLPSTHSVCYNIPPELHCPLCKEVMKDAVLMSKCCFKSFCDKCIRNHIISKSMCFCGATNVLVDDLLLNKAVRDVINRLCESTSSSSGNSGSMLQIQDAQSAQAKVPSRTLSAASKGEQMPPPHKGASNVPQHPVEKGKTGKAAADKSVVTHELLALKVPTLSEGSRTLVEELVKQKPLASEPGKKKKQNKAQLPLQVIAPTCEDAAAKSYDITPFGLSTCNPYWWSGMQLGMNGYMNPYAAVMPYMGYAPRLFDGRDFPKDKESGREVISCNGGDVSSMKLKHGVGSYRRHHLQHQPQRDVDEAIRRKRIEAEYNEFVVKKKHKSNIIYTTERMRREV